MQIYMITYTFKFKLNTYYATGKIVLYIPYYHKDIKKY